MIGSEEEYARILRKPLNVIKPAEEEERLVEEPPEVSESEVPCVCGSGRFF
jgi:hypothetical protein